MLRRIIALLLTTMLLVGLAVPASASASGWCNSLLTEDGQEIYGNYVSQLQAYNGKLSSSFSGENKDAFAAFDTVVWLLKKQHPEIFWLSYSSQSSSIKGNNVDGSSHVITCSPVFFNNYVSGGSVDQAAIQSMESRIADTAASIGTGATTYESVKLFNDWLVDNVTYSFNYDNSRSYEITGSLVDKTSACEGFAKAFKYLCDRAGIDCIVVCGKGIMSGVTYDHAWNYVKMDDGNWYMVDTTWNNISRNKTKWFLQGSSSTVGGLSLLRSHAPDGHGYPTLAEGNYGE